MKGEWDGISVSRRKGDDLIYAGKVDHGFDKVSAALPVSFLVGNTASGGSFEGEGGTPTHLRVSDMDCRDTEASSWFEIGPCPIPALLADRNKDSFNDKLGFSSFRHPSLVCRANARVCSYTGTTIGFICITLSKDTFLTGKKSASYSFMEASDEEAGDDGEE